MIQERNAQLLPGHFNWFARSNSTQIEKIISQVTEPLEWRYRDETEMLRNRIVDTEFQLRAGLLRDARDVEVTLIASCQVRDFENRLCD